MTDLSVGTAAPSRITIGDHSFDAHPLRFMDWGELDIWMRQRARALLRPSDLDEMPIVDREIMLRHVMNVSARVSRDAVLGIDEASTLARAIVGSSEYYAEMIWHSVKQGEPGMTREEFVRFIMERHDVDTIWDMLKDIEGSPAAESDAETGKAPAAEAADTTT